MVRARLFHGYGAHRPEEAFVVFAHPRKYLASQKVEESFFDGAGAVDVYSVEAHFEEFSEAFDYVV